MEGPISLGETAKRGVFRPPVLWDICDMLGAIVDKNQALQSL
jgi:hypothetical protein